MQPNSMRLSWSQVGTIPADCVRSSWSRQRFCSREQHDARLPPVPRGHASLPDAGAAGKRGGRPVLGALGADAAVAAIPCPTPQVSGQGRAVAAFAAPAPSFGRVVRRRRAGRRGSRVRHTGADSRPRPRLRGVQGDASRRSHLATQLPIRFPRQRFGRPAVFPVLRARELRAQRPHAPRTGVRRLASAAGRAAGQPSPPADGALCRSLRVQTGPERHGADEPLRSAAVAYTKA
nr:uncharacterized protein LOC129386549 [Dermacentor andersoni]